MGLYEMHPGRVKPEGDYVNKTVGNDTVMPTFDVQGNGRLSTGSGRALDPKRPVKPFIFVVALVAALGGLLFGFDIGGSGGTFVMPGFRKTFNWPPTECCKPPIGPEVSTTKTGYCMRYGCAQAEIDCLKVNTTYLDVTYTECNISAWDPNPTYVADQQGWITSLFSVGCFIGALPSGTMADKVGRKKTLMLNAVIFIVGATMQAACHTVTVMYIGRLIGGFAIGVLSNVVTMYQSEMAPEHVRGILVTMQQLCITFGIVLAAAMNVGLRHLGDGWRVSYGANILFAVTMVVCMVFLPDSPRWLVHVERYSDARKCLQRVRYDDEFEVELQNITKSVEADRVIGEGKWIECFCNNNNMLYRTCLGAALQFCQQMTGINSIMFFAPAMIDTFFGSDAAIYGNLAIQVVNFLSTFICIRLIDTTGRVSLLLSGGVGMLIGCSTVAILSSPLFEYKTNETIGILIIVFCCVYVCSFAFSWGPIAWVMCAEIFPQNLRGKCMSISTATNWAMATIIGKVTPYMYRKQGLDLWGTFVFFASWILAMTVFTWLCVPETAHVLLEDTDQLFDEFKVGVKRRRTSLNQSTQF